MFDTPISRRQALKNSAVGFGSLALASLLADQGSAAASDNPLAPKPPHFPARAKRIIFLFMVGGPSQVDTFDPKPLLTRDDGKPLPFDKPRVVFNGTSNLLKSPWQFAQHGESGLPVSELLPHLGKCIDDLCIVRSMHCDNPNHGPALFQMNNGTISPTRPSMGSWLTYGLGSENEDLPGYVVLCPGRPVRFAELWTSAFLPGEFQGTYINHTSLDPQAMVPHVKNAQLTPAQQRRQLDLLAKLNGQHAAERGGDDRFEARIRAMETAYRMQFAASDAFDVSREPAKIRETYGTSHYANGCLLARRLIERGVRLVQVYYGNGQPWDTHRNHNDTTRKLCQDIDRPMAALLTDLKRRGLLEDTLVVWGGEFGRTPTSEGGDGRDHNHWGFTTWLAGGGVRGGTAYGATDEFGFRAAENRVHVHDLHATLLHLMGIDHERLTFRHAGRDFRLTDVEGEVVMKLLA